MKALRRIDTKEWLSAIIDENLYNGNIPKEVGHTIQSIEEIEKYYADFYQRKIDLSNYELVNIKIMTEEEYNLIANDFDFCGYGKNKFDTLKWGEKGLIDSSSNNYGKDEPINREVTLEAIQKFQNAKILAKIELDAIESQILDLEKQLDPDRYPSKEKMEEKGVPRRDCMWLWGSAEKAIHESVSEIEKMPGDIRLTEAVILLGKAKKKVADYIDNVN